MMGSIFARLTSDASAAHLLNRLAYGPRPGDIGHVHFQDRDIYHNSIDPVAIRRHIGMVFQQLSSSGA